MVKFALFVLTHFVDHAVQLLAHPTDGKELLGIIGASIRDVFPLKEFLRLFESNAAVRIFPTPEPLNPNLASRPVMLNGSEDNSFV